MFWLSICVSVQPTGCQLPNLLFCAMEIQKNQLEQRILCSIQSLSSFKIMRSNFLPHGSFDPVIVLLGTFSRLKNIKQNYGMEMFMKALVWMTKHIKLLTYMTVGNGNNTFSTMATLSIFLKIINFYCLTASCIYKINVSHVCPHCPLSSPFLSEEASSQFYIYSCLLLICDLLRLIRISCPERISW